MQLNFIFVSKKSIQPDLSCGFFYIILSKLQGDVRRTYVMRNFFRYNPVIWSPVITIFILFISSILIFSMLIYVIYLGKFY